MGFQKMTIPLRQSKISLTALSNSTGMGRTVVGIARYKLGGLTLKKKKNVKDGQSTVWCVDGKLRITDREIKRKTNHRQILNWDKWHECLTKQMSTEKAGDQTKTCLPSQIKWRMLAKRSVKRRVPAWESNDKTHYSLKSRRWDAFWPRKSTVRTTPA